MKEVLQNVLQDILIKCTELKLNPHLLYPHLQIYKYLTQDETDLIVGEKTTTLRLLITFNLLKGKPEDLFLTLQKIFFEQKQLDLYDAIQKSLKRCGNEHLVWREDYMTNIDLSINEKVRDNLKKHYEQDLEQIENYWDKFAVNGVLKMDTFYNQNIVIKEKNRKLKIIFKNFDDVFSTDYKRIIIRSDAGYGKSTFVHEMARQWVKGENDWTKKFSFLFLFRLSEVDSSNVESVQSLLTKCLSNNDSEQVSKWLNDASYMEGSLFIFDGLDEFQYQFCKELNEILYGIGAKLAHVVVTSRPCKKLEDLENSSGRKLYIELKGYTDDGIKQQLSKFSIDKEIIGTDLKNILRVPLFNTLFCITHDDTEIGCENLCSAIEKFVQFACNRYRKINPTFTYVEEMEIILLLGQSAQKKFSYIKNSDVDYPDITQNLLILAISIGLISQQSTKEHLLFAHQTIAEYCAGYFWCKTGRLLTNGVLTMKLDEFDKVHFNRGMINTGSSFSRILSHIWIEYKLGVWQIFKNYVPLLNNYDNLPVRMTINEELYFSALSGTDQFDAIEQIQVLDSSNTKVFSYFNAVHFESGNKRENYREIKNFFLCDCTFDINPSEFFHCNNILRLHLLRCTIDLEDFSIQNINTQWPHTLILEELLMNFCDFAFRKFLAYVMKHCNTVKKLTLYYPFDIEELKQESLSEKNPDTDNNDFGHEWLPELQINKQLLVTVEYFSLATFTVSDLTNLFQTFADMSNLKNLHLIHNRALTFSEANALSMSFKNGLKQLERCTFNLKMKDIHKEDFFRNFTQLYNVTSIGLTSIAQTPITLKHFIEVFRALKLQKCELDFQEIFLSKDVLDAINS